MAINCDKPNQWKRDISQSVDYYNEWFLRFAPQAFRDTRIVTAARVEETLVLTNDLNFISIELLEQHPEVLQILRMTTCPPIARDRLIGLAGVSSNLVVCMENLENPHIPPRMPKWKLNDELKKIGNIILRMIDNDIFPWLSTTGEASSVERQRAATIVADRLCGTVADPIIRNAQEKRQLDAIAAYLEGIGYHFIELKNGEKFNQLEPGEFSFRTNVPVFVNNNSSVRVNIPVDVVIQSKKSKTGELPLLIEAKSAGDFTNVNKRRKEEAQKISQLQHTYGEGIRFGLFLCGYFDSGYLGYEAAEGIDWVWEHRIEDFQGYQL